MESNTTLMVKNNQGWSIQAECSSTGISIHLLDRWGLPTHPVTLIFTKIHQEDCNQPLSIFLEREIKKLNGEKRTYGFQVYKQNNQYYLVFDEYGIKGGGKGKIAAVIIGGTAIGTGAVMLGKESKIGKLAVIGSTLVSAGISAGMYAYQAEEKDITLKNYAINIGIGGLSGFLSGFISYVNPANYIVEQNWTTSIINSTLSSICSTLTHLSGNKYLLGAKEEITKEKLLASTIGGMAGSLVQVGTSRTLDTLFKEINDNILTATMQSGLKGGFEGLAGASTSKIFENILNKKKWHDHLGTSSTIGAFVGGIRGGVRGYYKYGENPLVKATQRHKALADEHGRLIEQSKKLGEEWKILDKSERAAERRLNALKSENNDPQAIEQANQYHSEEAKKLLQCELNIFELNDQIDAKMDQIFKEQEVINAVQNCTQVDFAVKLIKKNQGYLKEFEALKDNILRNQNESKTKVEELRNSQNPNTIALNEAESLFSQDSANLQKCLVVIEFINERMAVFQGIVDYLKSKPDFANQVALFTHRLSEEAALEKKVLERKTELSPHIISFSELFSTFPVVEVTEVKEEDWFELVESIVLVHTLAPDSIVTAFKEEFDYNHFDNQKYKNLFALQKTFTRQGEIGYHLNYKEKQFQGTLIKRPQIHWSWNQQVQSHSRGNWQASTIGIIEPLSTFEQPIKSTVFGISPYDTMTFGSHILAEQSTVLVPQDIEEEAKKHLTGFKGKIVPYSETSLRSAIHKQIKSGYPETWHLVDSETGQEIAEKEFFNLNDPNYNKTYGYFKITCLRKTDGQKITLIRGDGSNDSFEAIGQAVDSGKFIGLHCHSVTYWLEQNDTFKALRKFTKNPLLLPDSKKSFFSGYINQGNDIRKLCILDAFRFYEEMKKYAKETRAEEIGKYILNEAFYADIVSILLTRFSGLPLDFTRTELALMINTHRNKWLDLLHSLSTSNNETIFKEYCISLQKAIHDIYLVRKKMLKMQSSLDIIENTIPTSIEDLFEGRVFQEEWADVLKEKVDTNFNDRWPLTKPEQKFLRKLKGLLPSEEINLSSVLKMIEQMSHEDNIVLEKFQKLSYIKYGLELRLKTIYYKKLTEND